MSDSTEDLASSDDVAEAETGEVTLINNYSSFGEYTFSEDQKREISLQLAVKLAETGDTTSRQSHQTVVNTATAFYAFLRGGEDSAE